MKIRHLDKKTRVNYSQVSDFERFTDKQAHKRLHRSIFYIIQPHPLVPQELKLGRSKYFKQRLTTYKTICPSLKVLRTYCLPTYKEKMSIAFFMQMPGCERVSTEVIRVKDLMGFLKITDEYFGGKRKVTHTNIL